MFQPKRTEINRDFNRLFFQKEKNCKNNFQNFFDFFFSINFFYENLFLQIFIEKLKFWKIISFEKK